MGKPKVRVQSQVLDIVMECISLLLLSGTLVYTFWNYKQLPEIIPTHFGISSEPDQWGPKESIFILPGILVLIYALFDIIIKHPHIYNYREKITETNVVAMYRKTIRYLRLGKILISALFGSIIYNTVQIAHHEREKLNSEIILLIILLIFVPLFLARIKRTHFE